MSETLSRETAQTQAAAQKPGRGAYGLLTYLALAPASAVGGGLFLAPWLAVCALISAPFKPRVSGVGGFLIISALVLAFYGWSAASLAWSAQGASEQAIKNVALAFFGLVAVAAAANESGRGRALIRAGGIAALAVLALMLLAEALGDMPINRLGQPDAETGALMRNPGKGASVLVALFFCALGALVGGARWERTLWIALFGATAFLSLQFGMNTNTLALVIGTAAFMLGHAAPRIMPIVISAGLAGWLLAAPFITAALMPTLRAMESLPMSWRMRLEIWNFAIARIAEQPLIGHGLDGARAYQGMLLNINGFEFPAIPLHPHSFSLHVWLETGAIGAALGAIALIAIGVGVSRSLARQPGAAAAACGAIAAIGAIWNVSYGAWQEWWVAVPFVAAFLCAAARRDLPPAMSPHT